MVLNPVQQSMFVMKRSAPAFIAKAVIVVMCTDDKGNGHYQQPYFVRVKSLLQQQKNKAASEDRYRQKRMMVLDITMKQ